MRVGTRGISRSARWKSTPVSTTSRISAAPLPVRALRARRAPRSSRPCSAGRRRRASGRATVIVSGHDARTAQAARRCPPRRPRRRSARARRAPAARDAHAARAQPARGRAAPPRRSPSADGHDVGADLGLELVGRAARRRSRRGRRSRAGRTGDRPPRGSASSGTARRPRAWRRRSSSQSAAREVGSTPVVGSSRNSRRGPVHETAGQVDAPAHAAGVRAHLPVGGLLEPEQRQQLVAARARLRRARARTGVPS